MNIRKQIFEIYSIYIIFYVLRDIRILYVIVAILCSIHCALLPTSTLAHYHHYNMLAHTNCVLVSVYHIQKFNQNFKLKHDRVDVCTQQIKYKVNVYIETFIWKQRYKQYYITSIQYLLTSIYRRMK